MKKSELWLIWRIRDEKKRGQRRYRVGVLSYDENKDEYTFWYDYDNDFLLAKDNGFAYFPGFENTEESHKYESIGMFPNIASRLPRKERDDYLDVLNKYGLEVDDAPFKVLSVTRGRQVTDNYEFVPAFNKDSIEFEVAGVDHREKDKLIECSKAGKLAAGAKIKLVADPENKYDKFAVKVVLPVDGEDVLIGYVPRYYNKELLKLLDEDANYSAIITRVDLMAEIRDEKISVRVRMIFE